MQNIQKKQLIIFDMDGTLIDSGDTISNTVNFVRKNLGLEPLPKKELLDNMNNPEINSSEFFYGTTLFTDEQTELFTQYYNTNCTKDIILYEGIYELIKELSNHFTLSIATNASADFAKKMIKHLNIDIYFEFIIGSTDVSLPKPHPEMLLSTLQTLDINIKNSILIGDSNKDKKAAVACNMDYLLVNWGFSEHDINRDNSVIKNTQELHKKLMRLG